MIEFQQPSDAHDEQQQQQQQLLPSPTSSLGSKTAAAAPLTQPVKTSTNIFASIKASIKTETAHDIETVAAPPLPKKRKIAAASGATSSNGSNGRSPIKMDVDEAAEATVSPPAKVSKVSCNFFDCLCM